jgi:hypothetical protein
MTSEEEADSQETRPTRMVGREQQIGYIVAGLGVVLGVAVAATGSNPLLGLLGAVGAAGLAVSVRFGHRVVSAFVAILAGFVFTIPANFVFLGYGGYLMFRSSRAQAKLNASRPRLTPQQRRQAREARRAGKTSKSTGATGATTTGPAPRPTSPNRRYTPPKTKSGRRR